MKCFKLTLAIALGMCLLVGTTAQAGSFTSTQSGPWNVDATWGGAGHPTSTADTVTIVSGDIVTVSSADLTAVCGTLTINNAADAILSMEDGGLLKVETSVTVIGDGVFRFNAGDQETRPNLQATSTSVDLSGTITFPGTAGGRLSEETSGDYFDVPSGTCTFSGTYEVENDARLYVTGGTLNIENKIDADAANGTGGWFRVDSGTMDFNHLIAVTILSGTDFYVTGGTMRFREGITTTNGGFKQTGGTVTVDAGEAFQADALFVAP